MHAAEIVDRLERGGVIFASLVAGLDRPRLLHRPDEKTWSILEILRHLGDEEEFDFRPRLERTLDESRPSWDPIDPTGWAAARRYRDADAGEALARFQTLRASSVAWLRGVTAGAPDWSRAYQHPRLGPIRAGDLLASWAAHDALHIRQIAKRLFELAAIDAPGFSTRYAGEWGA